MSTLSKVAKTHEHARRLETFGHQIPKLNQLVVTQVLKANYAAVNIEELRIATESIINDDIFLQKSLMAYISDHPEHIYSYQILTSKNALIFEGALNMTQSHFIDIALKPLNATFKMDPDIPVMLGGGPFGDIKGTSQPNFIQTASLAILRALKAITNINDVPKLAEDDIYNISTSPVIQTAAFPVNFNVTKIDPRLDSWFYFYKDELSPSQGELLVPNLGYQLGGSRGDLRYADKAYAAQDCSSMLSHWTNASHKFTTLFMHNAYKATCLDYPKSICTDDPSCVSVLEVMTPICNGELQTNVFADDIFTLKHPQIGGHTGIITEIAGDCFLSLSDSRKIPDIEGLGYRWHCPYKEASDTWFYFRSNELEEQKCMVAALNEEA